MRTVKTRSGREPQSARTWWAAPIRDRIPAARDGRDASPEHGTSAGQDAGRAVAALYQLHYLALVRLAALLVPDLATAEDIVQDAFAAMHARWHMLPSTDAALAYLRRSVVHRSRSVPPLGLTEDTGEPASAVVSALRALSAHQREVVVLRYFADLPEAEISSATGMSAAAVRIHAIRAMSSLQAGLGPAGPADPGYGAATSGR
jgi:DNA-directed RNA polymerase specialized sigma24 family protein